MLMRWPARRRLLRTLLIGAAMLAILGYVVAARRFYVNQDAFVFETPTRPTLVARSLQRAGTPVSVTGPGLATTAWRMPAAGPKRPYWILYLHGSGATLSSAANHRRCDQLRTLGLNVLAVEYPGFGDVPGQPSESGMIAAARAGFEHLRRVDGVPASHIAIYGWSLGTGAAVPLARDVDEAALILEGTFTSIVDWAQGEHPFLPVAWLLDNPFRSDEAIAGVRSPTLFLHSPSDTVVPFQQGETMFAKALEPKRLVRLAGGHDFPNAEDADRYTAAIHDFLQDVVHWPVASPTRSAGLAVRAALNRGGLDAALGAWRAAVAEGDGRWNLAEYELQHVGRQLTVEGRHAEAIALLGANRDRFPDSALAWFELGRALAAAGRRDEAADAFKRSLAVEDDPLNPSHRALANLG
jgi:hypothetical protein